MHFCLCFIEKVDHSLALRLGDLEVRLQLSRIKILRPDFLWRLEFACHLLLAERRHVFDVNVFIFRELRAKLVIRH